VTTHILYSQYLQQQTQLSQSSRNSYAGVFSTLPAPTDLNADYFRQRSQELSPVTLGHFLTITRSFLKWSLEQAKTKAEKNRIELIISDLKTVKPRRLKETVTTEDLYTSEQLKAIFAACGDARDLAMFSVLYESGCRARELLSITFDRVKLLSDGTATVTINGKTGTREILIYRSVPALKAWLNVHPIGHGPIWTSLYRPFKPIDYTGLYSHAKVILERASLKVDKKRILHMFRHTRATELYNMGVRGIPLQKFMGWTSSDMENVYAHLSKADVDRELRSKDFGIEPETEKPAQLLSITKCPKCGENNDSKARFCTKCNLPLATDLIVQRLTEKEQLEFRVDTLEKALVWLLRRDGLSTEDFGLGPDPSPPLWDGVETK